MTDDDRHARFSMALSPPPSLSGTHTHTHTQIKMQGMRKIGERPDIARAVLQTEHDEEARP